MKTLAVSATSLPQNPSEGVQPTGRPDQLVVLWLGMALTAALATGCLSSAPPQRSVPHMASVQLSDAIDAPLPYVRPGDLALMSSAVVDTSLAQRIISQDIIAWSCASIDYIPPGLREDAIILIEWTDGSTHQWTLAHVTRQPTLQGGRDSSWHLDKSSAWLCRRDYRALPEIQDVVSFVGLSNFGNNNVLGTDTGYNRVLQIIMFRDWPSLRKALEAGLPETDRARRFNDSWEFYQRH